LNRLLPELRRTLARATSLAPAEFVTHAIDNCGVFVLGLFASNATVGVYAAIDKIARAGASLFHPLIKALFPRLSAYWIGDTATAIKLCATWTRCVVVFAVGFAITMYLLAPSVLESLFGDDWAGNAPLLRVFAAWLAASVTATVLGQFWLLARGERSVYSDNQLKVGTLQVLAAVGGAAFYGPLGLVAASVAAEVARIVLFYLAMARGGFGVSRCAS
jgi:PST family polysaccharide transporter